MLKMFTLTFLPKKTKGREKQKRTAENKQNCVGANVLFGYAVRL
jgi:hypothetical protein